jgi:hypothetical protein
VGEVVTAAPGGLPAQIRWSLTWDCGAEMARHATITATGLPVFFAHPHSPWERGSNENLNRIVREFFLKGVTIASDTDYSRWWLPKSTTDLVRCAIGRSLPSYSPNLSSRMLPLAESARDHLVGLDCRVVGLTCMFTGSCPIMLRCGTRW